MAGLLARASMFKLPSQIKFSGIPALTKHLQLREQLWNTIHNELPNSLLSLNKNSKHHKQTLNT